MKAGTQAARPFARALFVTQEELAEIRDKALARKARPARSFIPDEQFTLPGVEPAPRKAGAGTEKEASAKRQVSENTGNVKTSYDVWDDEGNKGTINIIRTPDGEVLRIFQAWTNKEGKTAQFEMSTGYGKGVTDDYIVKAIAEGGDLSLTPVAAPAAPQLKQKPPVS